MGGLGTMNINQGMCTTSWRKTTNTMWRLLGNTVEGRVTCNDPNLVLNILLDESKLILKGYQASVSVSNATVIADPTQVNTYSVKAKVYFENRLNMDFSSVLDLIDNFNPALYLTSSIPEERVLAERLMKLVKKQTNLE
jgi:hypothetical protein